MAGQRARCAAVTSPVQNGVDYAGVDEDASPTSLAWPAFAIVRAGFEYGGRALGDSTCSRNRALWKAKGRTFGAYVILGWDQNGPTPEQQVAAFVQQYGDRLPGELPPSLDLEADSDAAIGLTAAQALAWAERAWTALVARYGTCIVYTSLRVWLEVFGGLPSKMGASALWLKIPYVRNYHEAPALDWTNGINGQSMPRPWQTASPGVWIVQFQGDAWDVTTGRREQVDVDRARGVRRRRVLAARAVAAGAPRRDDG